MITIITKSITAQNTFTDAVQIIGWFNISISGTFAATVTIQRSPDNINWFDVNSFTAPFEGSGMDPEVMWYRVGVKTGGFTSGTVAVRLGQESAYRS